jgi:hypothetical protein
MIASILVALFGGSAGSWYWWTSKVHPTLKCKKCGGEKYLPIRYSHGRYRLCHGCDGTGLRLTWAAKQAGYKLTRAGVRR